MEEEYFWDALEYRVSREFAGMPDRRLRSWWCDGFIPEEYELRGPTPRISGYAWICKGRIQEKWSFTLFLKEPAASRDTITWALIFLP